MYVGLFIYFWSVFPMGAQAEHPARAPMWCHNSSSRLDAYTQPLSNLRAEKAQNPQSISSWWVWIIVLFNNKVKSSSGRIQHKLSSALCKVLPLKHRLATHSAASTSTDRGLITTYIPVLCGRHSNLGISLDGVVFEALWHSHSFWVHVVFVSFVQSVSPYCETILAIIRGTLTKVKWKGRLSIL